MSSSFLQYSYNSSSFLLNIKRTWIKHFTHSICISKNCPLQIKDFVISARSSFLYKFKSTFLIFRFVVTVIVMYFHFKVTFTERPSCNNLVYCYIQIIFKFFPFLPFNIFSIKKVFLELAPISSFFILKSFQHYINFIHIKV